MSAPESFDFSQLDSSPNPRKHKPKKKKRSSQQATKLYAFMVFMLVVAVFGLGILLYRFAPAASNDESQADAIATKTTPVTPDLAKPESKPSFSNRLPMNLMPDQSSSDQSSLDQSSWGESEVGVLSGDEESEADLSLAHDLQDMIDFESNPLEADEPETSNSEPSLAVDMSGMDEPNDAQANNHDQTILSLYRDRQLFKKTQYTVLRSIYADRFASEYEDQIREGLGDDYQEAMEWFDEHPELKEELYTAIKPDHDDVAEAIGLFNSLREKFPDQIVPHAPLAIATAVVWDKKNGVYNYQGHSRRTHSVMPSELTDAVGNFEYFLEAQRIMQGRGQFLPWEFLVNVVDHPTPIEERRWAVIQYLPKRAMFGECYRDVPYDTVMLNTHSETCRLDGKPYTLANLRQFGGVCSMQADFAARVGKSLGVPAAAVSGAGRFGGSGHAWVMWAEINAANASGVQFTLESFGRYRGDHYYIGNLKNPQTGERMTDRQLELRLQTVGIGPMAKRQADWLMQSFSMVRDQEKLDVLDQIRYLNQVLKVCPLSEQAWRTLANMSRDGVIEPRHEKLMLATINGLFTSFASFPDFTWEIFDDLIQFQKLPHKRNSLYEQLVHLYERSGRPDLACQAVLRYADYLVQDEKPSQAVAGLALTILKFPQEGRYVPPMLDRMEQVSQQAGGNEQDVLAFYRRFLPLIDQKRGDTASDYCIKMYQRGIARFEENGDQQTATMLKAELAKLQS